MPSRTNGGWKTDKTVFEDQSTFVRARDPLKRLVCNKARELLISQVLREMSDSVRPRRQVR